MSLFDRLLGSVVRRGVRHARRVAWRDPDGALRIELQRRATVAAADFATERMPEALFCADKFQHLTYALRQAPLGLVLEFGVFKGATINHMARLQPQRRIFGFDSFKGLPEDWVGKRFSEVNFNLKGNKPKVERNVTLIEGWFDATLPAFLTQNTESIGLLHVDCDIYSSTKTVLDLCIPRLEPGAVIVFDEFFNYRGYQLHEYKALFEAVERYDLAYRFVGFSGEQVSIVVDRVGRPNG